MVISFVLTSPYNSIEPFRIARVAFANNKQRLKLSFGARLTGDITEGVGKGGVPFFCYLDASDDRGAPLLSSRFLTSGA